nr:hypothetical protein [Gammaproteobacteria bacterium]
MSTRPYQVATRADDAVVVVVNKVRLDGPMLRQARTLRLVCLAATGTDNVDLATAAKLRLPVCNVRNYATRAVAQHTFALIAVLCNRLLDYHSAVRAGRWHGAPGDQRPSRRLAAPGRAARDSLSGP